MKHAGCGRDVRERDVRERGGRCSEARESRCAWPRGGAALAIAFWLAPAPLQAAFGQEPTTSPSPTPDKPAGAEWEAPPEARSRPNPVEATQAAIEKGRALYRRHCTACHGSSGKGDGPASQFWREPPQDLTSAARQARISDGELFWKITNGRKAGADVVMPGFEREIGSEEDRWKVVLYVRTLKSPDP